MPDSPFSLCADMGFSIFAAAMWTSGACQATSIPMVTSLEALFGSGAEPLAHRASAAAMRRNWRGICMQCLPFSEHGRASCRPWTWQNIAWRLVKLT